MSKQEKFFDVYVSYPPNTDRERIHACLYDNLPENEVESLIQALAERPQAIMAEKCSQDERENAQHYFSYLGLDVIVRQAMELEEVDELDSQECKTCHFDLTEKNELAIQRKRIEWQGKISFEHKKQTEIAHKLKYEREQEEKKLRKKIRAELESQLLEELGQNPELAALAARKKTQFLLTMAIVFAVLSLLTLGYIAAKFF